jgi:hypothetical protein
MSMAATFLSPPTTTAAAHILAQIPPAKARAPSLRFLRSRPTRGARNPFQASVSPPTHRHLHHDAETFVGCFGRFNVSPMPDSTCTPAPSTSTGSLPSNVGFLVLRAYLPNGGFDQVPLPSISLQYTNGEVVTLPQCHSGSLDAAKIGQFSSVISTIQQFLTFTPPASRSTVLPVPCGLPGAAACPPDLEFYRPSDSVTNSFLSQQRRQIHCSPGPTQTSPGAVAAATFKSGERQPVLKNPDCTRTNRGLVARSLTFEIGYPLLGIG